MKRKISNIHAAIIKELLVQNYCPAKISNYMEIQYNIKIAKANINNIRKGVSYSEIRPDLNSKIKDIYCNNIKNTNVEEISSIKWALSEGFSTEDILNSYPISKKEITSIKMGYMPYWGIAPEFNDILSVKFPRKKKTNIDEKMVVEIKKEFVKSKGDITLAQVANKYQINKGSVTNILSLNCYVDMGVSYNHRITTIKEKMEAERIKKRKEVINKKISNENIKKKINRKNLIAINEKIKASETKMKSLKESANNKYLFESCKTPITKK